MLAGPYDVGASVLRNTSLGSTNPPRFANLTLLFWRSNVAILAVFGLHFCQVFDYRLSSYHNITLIVRLLVDLTCKLIAILVGFVWLVDDYVKLSSQTLLFHHSEMSFSALSVKLPTSSWALLKKSRVFGSSSVSPHLVQRILISSNDWLSWL